MSTWPLLPDPESCEVAPDFSQIPLPLLHLTLSFPWMIFCASASCHIKSVLQDSAQTPDSSLIFVVPIRSNDLLLAFTKHFIILILPDNFQVSILVINSLLPPTYFLMYDLFEDKDLSQLLWVAISHNLGDYFSLSGGGGVQDQNAGRFGMYWDICLMNGAFSLCPHAEKTGKLFGMNLFYKAVILFMRTLSSWPISSPPDIITLGGRISTYKFWGKIDIQSMAGLYSIHLCIPYIKQHNTSWGTP